MVGAGPDHQKSAAMISTPVIAPTTLAARGGEIVLGQLAARGSSS
jgi:hypothetical protein